MHYIGKNSFLVTGGTDQAMIIWSHASKQSGFIRLSTIELKSSIKSVFCHFEVPDCLITDEDDIVIYVGAEDGSVKIFDIKDRKILKNFEKLHTGKLLSNWVIFNRFCEVDFVLEEGIDSVEWEF